jgi:uncharacterized protein YjbJ (UPF0337 family)
MRRNKADNDRLIGAGKQIIGGAEEMFGRLAGDAKLQVDGKAEQMAGKAENAIGSVKDPLRH